MIYVVPYQDKISNLFSDKPKPSVVPSSLFTRKDNFGLEELPFDLLIDEYHGMDFDICDHAVENGDVISDHIVKRLRSVRITGMFTNHPIDKKFYEISDGEVKQLIEETKIETPSKDGTFAKVMTNTALERYENLKKIADRKKPVRLITSLEDYPSLVITNVSAPRTANDGESITFTMQLREIRTARVATVTSMGVWTPPEPPTDTSEGQAMSAAKNNGSQTAQDASKKKAEMIAKGNKQQLSGGQ